MLQDLVGWFWANLDTIGKIAGVVASFATGVSTVLLWWRTDIKRYRAKIKSLEADIADEKAKKRTLSKQVQEWHEAFEAAQREIREAALSAVLERHDRLMQQGERAAAADVLREFFARERLNLSRAAGGLGDWYCDEGGGADLGEARRFFALAALAEPGNPEWQKAAEELKLAADMVALEQRELPDDADEFEGGGLAADRSPQDAVREVAALLDRGAAQRSTNDYRAAYLLVRRAYRIALRSLGEQHRETLVAQNHLATCLEKLGFYRQALPHLRHVLSIFERTLGENHPDTASSLNNLAMFYDAQSRYAESESLHLRALAIREKVLGGEHPDTAISLNNLAMLYEAQGRYDEAEPLLVRALTIREKVLGGKHPNTAVGLNNLAMLYEAQGRYDEAEPLYLRALAVHEKVLGGEHPDTAQNLNNLAAFYRDQGRYEEAEPLILRALAIFEKVLGAEHPHTVKARNNLSILRADRDAAAGQKSVAGGAGWSVQFNFGDGEPPPSSTSPPPSHHPRP